MATSNKINTLADDLISRVKIVSKFRGNVDYLFDDLELLEKRKEGTSFPIAGVMFNERTAVPDSGKGSGLRLGLTADYSYKVLIVENHERTSRVDRKEFVTDLLNDIAEQKVGKGPTGQNKLWRFVKDGPTVNTGDGFIQYEQVWSIVAGLL